MAEQITGTVAAVQRSFIACVDDDPSIREALSGFLRAFGFRVEVFASAEEFLNSEEIGDVQCLITDVKLGGMSGLQMQHQLIEAGRAIPTIVITAFADDQVYRRALKAGAVSVLRKPIPTDELLAAIDAVIGNRRNR